MRPPSRISFLLILASLWIGAVRCAGPEFSYTSTGIDTTTSLIDQIKPGQRYTVNVRSEGCFHESKLTLEISRKQQGYFARFKMKGDVEGKKMADAFKQVRLNDSQLDSIRRFEKQLAIASASNLICTTVDYYTITAGATRSAVTINDCDWQGIGRLVPYLFPKPPTEE